MGHNWIIDVLADLKAFAQENDLALLAGQLDEAALIARAEIASMAAIAPNSVRGDVVDFGRVSRAAGASGRA